MKARYLLSLTVLVLSAMGCALRAPPVSKHTLYAKDNAVLESEETIRFAVVGNTRGAVPWRDKRTGWSTAPGAGESVAADLQSKVVAGELDFAVFMGDQVRWGLESEWGRFGHRFNEALDGEQMAQGEHERIPALIVAGNRDFVFDDKLVQLDKTFPGTGASIGFKRVASWHAFDLKVGEHTWRMLTLDSNLKAMGSRSREQRAWIPKAAKGEYDHLLMFMHHPRVTLGVGQDMNADSIPSNLIDQVEEHTGILKLRAVFSGNSHTSEAYLPEGPIGTAYVVSGGGGDVAQDLRRWGDGEPAGYEGVVLEPLFDLALQSELDARASRVDIAEKIFDKARAEGEWEGFIGSYDAKVFPLTGYWVVELAGETISMTYRHVDETGAARDLYQLADVEENGWMGSQLP